MLCQSFEFDLILIKIFIKDVYYMERMYKICNMINSEFIK